MNNPTTTARIALDVGEQAYHEGRIKVGAWHLYDRLVVWSGKRGYCWYGVEKMASVFGRCARHINRWLHELTDAGLIARVRTRNVAETYIVAYGGPPVHVSFFDAAMSDPDQTSMSDPTIKEKTLTGGDQASPSEASFEQERPEGTPPPSPSPAPPASPAIQELRAAGLVDERTIAELARKPLAVIRQAVAYVQRHAAGPGLIAWLVRNGVLLDEEPAAPRPARSSHVSLPPEPAYDPDERFALRRLVMRPDGSCYTEVIPNATPG